MCKRLLSIVMILCLMLTVVPAVWAEGETTVGKIELSADMVTASSTFGSSTADKVVDGAATQESYWEGHSMPASLTLDMQGVYVVDHIVLKVPGHWGDRTQTATISSSKNGVVYTTLVEDQELAFTLSDGNTVTIDFLQPVSAQYLQLTISSNSGSNYPQIAEWEVYGYADPDAELPIGKIDLTTDMVTVSGTNHGSKDNTVDGDQSSFWNGNGATATYTLNLQSRYIVDCVVLKLPTSWVNARTQVLTISGSTDGIQYAPLLEGTQSLYFEQSQSNTVVMSLPANTSLQYLQLAFVSNTGDNNAQIGEIELYGYVDSNAGAAINQIPLTTEMITASGTGHGQVEDAIDGDRSTYWQGNNQTATLSLDLQAVYTLNHFIVRLPNSGNWGTRTQTVTVTGSVDGQTYTPVLEGEQQWQFVQNVGDCIVILDTPVNVRYLQLAFSNNTGATGPQVGEWELYGSLASTKEVTVTFAGKNDAVVTTQTVSSAEELVALLDTVKAPALGGYACVGWDNSAEDLQAWFNTAADGATLTVRAVYEVDTDVTYDITVTDAIAFQTEGLTFDSCVTVTATGDATPTYWLLDGTKVGFGQKSYVFYVSGANTIVPQYEVITSTAEVVLQQAMASSNGETFNLSVVAQTSVLGKEVTEFGVVYAASPANLTDSAKSVKVVSSKAVNQQYMTHLLHVEPGKYRYAAAYMTLSDGTTKYSAKAVQFHTNDDGTAEIVYKEGWQS